MKFICHTRPSLPFEFLFVIVTPGPGEGNKGTVRICICMSSAICCGVPRTSPSLAAVDGRALGHGLCYVVSIASRHLPARERRVL